MLLPCVSSRLDRPWRGAGGVAGVKPEGKKARKTGMEKRLDRVAFGRVLLIKPSSLGDVVRCLPVLHGLRERYPRARLSWLVRPDCAAIVRGLRGLDEVIEFDRRRYGRVGVSVAAAGEFVGFAKGLRARGFDLVLDLQGLFRSGFLAWATGAGVRLGFGRRRRGFTGARELAWVFYTHRLAAPGRVEHAVESYWRFAEALGFGARPKRFDLEVDEGAAGGAREMLRGQGVSEGVRYGVLLIGGSERAKWWPGERYGQLARVLKERQGTVSVLLGAGPEEEAAAEEMARAAGVVSLVGKTTLAEAVAVLRGARWVVGNDSGLLHVAAALHRPVVGLYGPTDPLVVGPYGERVAVVEAGAGLARRGRYSREPGHRMENITVEEVAEQVGRKVGVGEGGVS